MISYIEIFGAVDFEAKLHKTLSEIKTGTFKYGYYTICTIQGGTVEHHVFLAIEASDIPFTLKPILIEGYKINIIDNILKLSEEVQKDIVFFNFHKIYIKNSFFMSALCLYQDTAITKFIENFSDFKVDIEFDSTEKVSERKTGRIFPVISNEELKITFSSVKGIFNIEIIFENEEVKQTEPIISYYNSESINNNILIATIPDWFYGHIKGKFIIKIDNEEFINKEFEYYRIPPYFWVPEVKIGSIIGEYRYVSGLPYLSQLNLINLLVSFKGTSSYCPKKIDLTFYDKSYPIINSFLKYQEDDLITVTVPIHSDICGIFECMINNQNIKFPNLMINSCFQNTPIKETFCDESYWFSESSDFKLKEVQSINYLNYTPPLSLITYDDRDFTFRCQTPYGKYNYLGKDIDYNFLGDTSYFIRRFIVPKPSSVLKWCIEGNITFYKDQIELYIKGKKEDTWLDAFQFYGIENGCLEYINYLNGALCLITNLGGASTSDSSDEVFMKVVLKGKNIYLKGISLVD